MNAVEVCAGTFRGVEQPGCLLAEARSERERQLVAAANGYVTPIQGGAAGLSRGDATGLLVTLQRLAEADDAVFAVLHVADGSPILGPLRDLDFDIGVTDLYPYVDVAGGDLDAFLTRQRRSRRLRMRREARAFTAQGGHLEVARGGDALPFMQTIADLEAKASWSRAGTMSAGMAREVNEAVFQDFGSSAFAVLVRDRTDRVVACSVVVSSGRTLLLRTVGFNDEFARPLGGYFQASFYGPLAVAQAEVATVLLLGPGSLVPKLRRGADLTPLLSAVPRRWSVVAQLLRHTDASMRRTLVELRDAYGHVHREKARRCQPVS
jgi:hypothetical protein